MRVNFSKMHGLGNDFMVVDNREGKINFVESQLKSLADRRTGIGFDQVLVVESPSSSDVEFNYRIFNADGSEVEHCGNGARCFARFVRDRGLTDSTSIPVNTTAGKIKLVVLPDDRVRVLMGVPTFSADKIPLQVGSADNRAVTAGQNSTDADEAASNSDQKLWRDESKVVSYRLLLPLTSTALSGLATDALIDFDQKSSTLGFNALAIANPHAVIRVRDVESAPVEQLGRWLETHTGFPQRVNVGFLAVKGRNHGILRVFERGVGETRACGTGACAAVATGIEKAFFDQRVVVDLPGGALEIYWPDTEVDIEMTGPCTTVFEGHIEM